MRIPASRSGKGKISLSIQGSFREIDAVTEGAEIPTGALVQVQAIEGPNLVLVRITSTSPS
ncbi:hypothetical protein GC167_09600 [bacterium]|nr:hypothetical protein [bacterium]